MLFACILCASWITISDKIMSLSSIFVVVLYHLECFRNRKCLQSRQSSEIFWAMLAGDSVLDYCSSRGPKKFIFYFYFICHIYPPFTRKRIVSLYFGREVRTRLGVAFFEVYGPPVFHIKVGRPVKCLAQGHNKRTCRLVLHSLP